MESNRNRWSFGATITDGGGGNKVDQRMESDGLEANLLSNRGELFFRETLAFSKMMLYILLLL